MRTGCAKGAALFDGAGLGGACGAAGVAADVVAPVFLPAVVAPVSVFVVVGVDGAERQDGLGAVGAPAGAGDAHAVEDEVAAGAFDDAGGDGPSGGEGFGVVQ